MESSEYNRMFSLEERHWWFAARRELVLSFVSGTHNKILDVGCGTGANTSALSAKGKVTGVDNSPLAVSFARKRGLKRIFLQDAEKLRLGGRFNYITLLDVLEHCDDDAAVLKNCRRLLEKNGKLIVTVPAFMMLWEKHDELLHHKRRYNGRSFSRLVHSCGFDIERMTFWNSVLFPLVALKRLLVSAIGIEGHGADMLLLPPIFNDFLREVLEVENKLIERGLNLPLGLSIIAVCKRRGG